MLKLRTIWTTPAMDLSGRFKRTRDSIAFKIAFYLPRRVQYWCTIYMIGVATAESGEIPAETCENILSNLPRPKDLR